MIRITAVTLALLAAIPPPPPARVWIAFTPRDALSPAAAEDLIRERPADVRALMVFAGAPGDFAEDAYATISALHEIGASAAGFDEEGMARLRDWGVDRLPAIVVERGGDAHIAVGRDARLSEVTRCSR